MPISNDGKAAIDTVLQSATKEKNGLPGVIYSAINKNGECIYEGAAGVKSLIDPESKMTTDAVLYIASCTKLITAIACLQLVEQGTVTLDDPAVIETILPEAAKSKIIGGEKGNFQFHAPKNSITLRMLLDHSSGFSYSFFNDCIRDLLDEHGSGDEFSGIEEPYRLHSLISEPGERWNYSIGLDWAGILVERLTKMNLSEYFRKHIFQPLGLKEIHFGGERPDLAPRLAGMHQRDSQGNLTSRDHLPLVHAASFYAGGAGCVSTVQDYLKILNCLLNDGISSDGTRILKPETVELMFRGSLKEDVDPQLANLIPTYRPELSNDCLLSPGFKKSWGLSFLLTLEKLPSGRAPNSAWWAGIANCYYTVDRTTGVATMIATQILPFSDAKVWEVWAAAETELYKHLPA